MPAFTQGEDDRGRWAFEDDWEAWANSIVPGSRCVAGGADATITEIRDDGAVVLVDATMERALFEWEDMMPPERWTRR